MIQFERTLSDTFQQFFKSEKTGGSAAAEGPAGHRERSQQLQIRRDAGRDRTYHEPRDFSAFRRGSEANNGNSYSLRP